MADTFDIIVIGAGIAGASAAAHLAETQKLLVLEMEERPGFHSTGRSAAAFEPNYGPAPIRALSRAARRHFDALGALSPRETIFVMPKGQDEVFAAMLAGQVGMREISPAECRARHPLLRDGYVQRALFDPGTADIDVDLLHQSYLRLLKSRGGALLCNHPVMAIEHDGNRWSVTAGDKTFRTQTIVNAAGAWGDRIAALAGARLVGLQPRRRSVAVVPPPDGCNVMDWPLIGDVGETWYCKPQSGKLLVSPADATPVEPHDASADDMALALGIDRFQQAAVIEVTRVEHTWGGLRSFAPDGNPVCGFDPECAGFFWLIGQGGYGIQTAPALSRLAAALVAKSPIPPDILAAGCDPAALSPHRFRN
jgi:D-arginine dehydrogenase